VSLGNRYGGKRRRKSEPTQVKNLVQGVLGDLGLEAAARSYRIGERWEEAVGAQVASHCRPVALRGGVLEACVDSSVWCQQLQLQSPQILESLRETFGEEAPSALRFRIGPLPPSPDHATPRGNSYRGS
jgi:predicted nucleic acid-binding Zn ribbon protein